MAMHTKPALPGSDLPFARITKTGKLSCTGCRKRTEPRLIEPGYIVTNSLDLQASPKAAGKPRAGTTAPAR